jgi:hypothetical protein
MMLHLMIMVLTHPSHTIITIIIVIIIDSLMIITFVGDDSDELVAYHIPTLFGQLSN